RYVEAPARYPAAPPAHGRRGGGLGPMTSPGESFDSSQPTDPQLAQFIEQAIAQLERGEPVDVDALVGEHVEYAAQLRQLLPAIEGMLGLNPGTRLTAASLPLAISPSRG